LWYQLRKCDQLIGRLDYRIKFFTYPNVNLALLYNPWKREFEALQRKRKKLDEKRKEIRWRLKVSYKTQAEQTLARDPRERGAKSIV